MGTEEARGARRRPTSVSLDEADLERVEVIRAWLKVGSADEYTPSTSRVVRLALLWTCGAILREAAGVEGDTE